MGRLRSVTSTVLLVLVGVILPIGVVAGWAETTIYDSDSFSQRAVSILDSPAVRRELADRLTEQLARSGNQNAIAFRPAVVLAIDAVVDTDTFRSIFRTAIRRTHEALLQGSNGSSGLDLSDSFAIVAASLQVPTSGTASSGGGLGQSLADVTAKLGQLHIWDLDSITTTVAIVGLLAAAGMAALAIGLSRDRRHRVATLGWILVIDGAVIIALLKLGRVYAGRRIQDDALSQAVQGALARGTSDLNAVAFWMMGYGIVVAAAAGALGSRARTVTPAVVRERFSGWVARRRATTGGTVAMALLGLVLGLLLIQDPRDNLDLLAIAAGLWITYLSVVELVSLIRRGAPDHATTDAAAGVGQRRARNVLIGAAAGVVVLGLMTAGVVVSTRRAAHRAAAAGIEQCNGSATKCDLHLNQVLFPGTHNSMSSALYPGWLFGEQVRTISQQLNAGVRALLVDTHYGVPSSSRLPGSETPIVLTDRVAGSQVAPPGEVIDPEVAARAAQLAARAPKAADATRDIYLCHNYCELGAVRFSSVLGDVKTFLDSHPDEVVILDIQDATSPADTAAAITAAGLADRAAVLEKGKPLPTLRELIDAGTNLLVFAEVGGSGAPPWYQRTYDWFQETPYTYPSVEAFDCAPNRGTAAAPLLLINHWVSEKGLASPAAAAKANGKDTLQSRLERCLRERGRMPNIIAVDFAGRGDLVATVDDINNRLVRLLDGVNGPTVSEPAAATTVPGGATTTVAPPAEAAAGPALTAGSITSLTGGDPAAFCAVLADARIMLYGWALALASEPAAEAGRADLAFAPTLVRRLPAYVSSAPAELKARAQPVLDRARAALQVLRDAGVDGAGLTALADESERLLSQVTGLDSVTVVPDLEDAVAAAVGAERLPGLASGFAAAHPQAADLLDLGDVPADVAAAAGFDCLSAPAGLIDLTQDTTPPGG
jgi:hypothetical protein